MRKLLYAAMLPLLLSSCSSYKYTRLSGTDGEKIAPASVTIYPRHSKAPKDVKPTGMIKYKAKGKESKMWKKVRKIAGAHGSNAAYLDLYKGKHDEWKHKGVVYTFTE